jgi:putative tryptophan/tyrosine transport system substrate-binding protein
VRRAIPALGTAVTALLLVVLGARAAAQAPHGVPRIGYISPGSPSDAARLRRFDAFRRGLRDLGYVEGRNIRLEPRWAEGQDDRYHAVVLELVRLKVDAIVTVGGRATLVAQQATRTIPIVMSVVVGPCAPRWKPHRHVDDGT